MELVWFEASCTDRAYIAHYMKTNLLLYIGDSILDSFVQVTHYGDTSNIRILAIKPTGLAPTILRTFHFLTK